MGNHCQRKAGQQPPARSGEGPRWGSGHPSPSSATCQGRPASPPTPSSPRDTPFQTARGCPSESHALVAQAAVPGPPAPPKAPKERKADSLRCPLKPPLHFHQPRSRWLPGSTPRSLPASLPAHVSPGLEAPPPLLRLADPAGRINSLVHSLCGLGSRSGRVEQSPAEPSAIFQEAPDTQGKDTFRNVPDTVYVATLWQLSPTPWVSNRAGSVWRGWGMESPTISILL